jgi:hypothetical protein
MKNNPENSYITPEDVENIVKNVSVIDYFFHLEQQEKVKFERKSGHDFYFRTEDNKFSVSKDKFFDFKGGTGGQIIKAVMMFENKSWFEALKFLHNFSGQNIDYQQNLKNITERKKNIETKNAEKKEVKIIAVKEPENQQLLAYFRQRGISLEIIKKYTKEVHFQYDKNKENFSIGIQNLNDGWELRNYLSKLKLGKSGFSVINEKPKADMLVFEGMTDMLSFLQLKKIDGDENDKTLVSLNSVTNVPKFIEKYADFKGKIFLCLDGDKAGNEATEKIKDTLKNTDIQDVRPLFNIAEGKNKDLNDELKNFLQNIENQNEKPRTVKR